MAPSSCFTNHICSICQKEHTKSELLSLYFPYSFCQFVTATPDPSSFFYPYFFSLFPSPFLSSIFLLSYIFSRFSLFTLKSLLGLLLIHQINHIFSSSFTWLFTAYGCFLLLVVGFC